MQESSLDLVHRAFVEWRKAHRLGRYPNTLRRYAIATLADEELAALSSRLGLSLAHVKRWGVCGSNHAVLAPATAAVVADAVGNVDETPSPNGFYEIRMAAAPHVEVELHGPTGAMLRVRGAVDTMMVLALARTLLEVQPSCSK